MNSAVALIFCLVLVVGLLYLERKYNAEASLALWLPTVWMLIYASRPLGRWFGYSSVGASVETGSPLDRLVLSILIVLGLIILIRRKMDWSNIFRDNFWLILLFLYMAMSITWSDIPFVSFKRWFKTVGDIPIALVVLSERKPLQALESVLRRTAYVLIPFSIVLIKYFPHLGVGYSRWSGLAMWSGVTLFKNELGQLCALSSFLLIWSLLRGFRAGNLLKAKSQTFTDVLVIGMGIYLLNGPGESYSATSVSILLIGTVILCLLYWRKNLAMFVGGHLKPITVSLVLFYWFFYDGILGIVAPLLGRDVTLTDRTAIWRPLLEYASHNPVFGVGYGGFWAPENTELVEQFSSQFILAQAHNGYLAVYVELGIVGLVLLTVFLLAYCGKVRRELNHSFEWGVYGICLLPMSLLYNNTEISFLQSPNYLWSTMVFLTIVFSASSYPATENGSRVK